MVFLLLILVVVDLFLVGTGLFRVPGGLLFDLEPFSDIIAEETPLTFREINNFNGCTRVQPL